jgi:prepilin-type N-terminal cleavage/methylation domain-containing protein
MPYYSTPTLTLPRSTGRGNKKPRGFTLIEILMVVVILGIMSAVILPQLGTRDDLKVASAARTLMADLLYAQSRAVAMQKMQYVIFDTANKKYDVCDVMSPQHIIANPVTGAQYEQVFGVAPLDNVTFSSVSFDGQTVLAFDSLGTPYSYNGGVLSALGSGSVVLKCRTNQLTVSVQPYSGEIKVQ